MSRRAWLAFAAVSVIWGIPYLFIKVAVDEGVPPAFLAWVRVVIGAGVLVAAAWRAGTLRSVRDRLRWLVAFAVVEIVVPFPLIAAWEPYVDSSVAAIIIATAPLFVALLALRFDATERTGDRGSPDCSSVWAAWPPWSAWTSPGRPRSCSGRRHSSSRRLAMPRGP